MAVFFDATDTTSTVTTRPFHDPEYRWDFGDAASGTWNAGSRPGVSSRNSATGPVAAHVFESPGTYTVTLNVFGGTNTASSQVQITVQDPNVVFAGTNSICIAATSTPVAGAGGCPSGAAVAQQPNWPTVFSTYVATGKRVLLKGGDIFTGAATANLTINGPGTIGSYPVNSTKAILRTTGSSGLSTILTLKSGADWRIMDLEFDGQSNGARQAVMGNGNFSQMLFLRLNIHDIGGGIEIPLWTASSPLHDQLFLVDSTIQRLNAAGSATHGWLAGASRQAILGTLFDDSNTNSAEHMVRIEYVDRGVYSYNTIQKVAAGKEMFALRAPCSNNTTCGSGEYFGTGSPNVDLGLNGSAAATRKVVVSSNLIKTNTYAGVRIGQVNNADSTLLQDIILEKNYYQNVSGGGEAVEAIGTNITIRDELMDVSNDGGPYNHYGIFLDSATAGIVAANNFYIYNNTIYSHSTGDFVGIWFRSGTNSNIVMNNLMYAPSANSSPVAIIDSGSGNVMSNNSTDSQLKPGPSFTNGSGLFNTSTDFKLNVGSYAIDAGFAAPVFSDFFGQSRPQGAGLDIGATDQ